MKKIEIIWRELLFESIERGRREFTQKQLAQKFDFSTSTVFQALKAPRKMGAVRVSGRNFVLEDPEKLLYHWASVRDLDKDTIFKARIDLPIFEIEGRMPPEVIFAGYKAAREILAGASAADYDRVYVYSESVEGLRERFEFKKGRENLIVLKADKFMSSYGQTTTLAQTFVDLWNLSDWYAREFLRSLKEKINELLP